MTDMGESTGTEWSQPEITECPLSKFQLESLLNKSNRFQQFASTLSAPQLISRALELLPDIISEAESLGISRAKIARACQIAEGTLSRWAGGSVQPHFLMAQSVANVLSRVALTEADVLLAKIPVSQPPP